MTIIDSRTQLCTAAATAATAGTWTNVGSQIKIVKSDSQTTDLGNGEPIWLVIQVTTDIDAAGTGTITFRLASDNTATIHATTSTVHWTSAAIATATTPPATLLAGVQIAAIQLPRGTYEAYIGIQVLATTQDTTTGAIDAYLTHDIPGWVAVPDAL